MEMKTSEGEKKNLSDKYHTLKKETESDSN